MTSNFKFAISLICPDGNHETIQLPHRELVYIGRSPETRIVDPRCSRKQIQMCADLNTGDVQVVQLGQNSSALDGMEMIKDKVYMMKPHSTLHVLTGCFPQKLDIKNVKDGADNKHRHKSASDVDSRKSSSNNPSKSKDGRSGSGSTPTSGKEPAASKQNRKRPSDGETNGSSSSKKSKPSDNFKKTKVNGEINSGVKSSSKERCDSGTDEHMKDVAAKLELLKSSAKQLKTPTKATATSSGNGGFKVPQSPAPAMFSSPFKYPTWSGGSQESRWDVYESLYIYTGKGVEHRKKIAAFDIDGTIITTQSGKVFPTHPGDWKLLYYKEIPKKLKKLHAEDGYKIVFFTNQLGVSKGKLNIADLKVKFEDLVNDIGVPVQILVSTKGGIYRKPCTGMWTFLTEKLNGGLEVELSQSFYVGDAAGRAKDWAPKKKKDFSCSDRLFAINIGLEFRTPEEYFVGYPTAKFSMPAFDPRAINPNTHLLTPPDAKLVSGSQEIILLAGYPASGKSFFAKKYLEPKGYVVINRDTLGTQQKCLSTCKDALKKGQCVVVDNTNPDAESRAKYISLALEQKIPCRCFVFNTTFEHVKHNERFREITDKSHQPINEMILNSFKKKYVLPEKKEGFAEMVYVNFVPKFKDPKLEELYKMFLLEK